MGFSTRGVKKYESCLWSPWGSQMVSDIHHTGTNRGAGRRKSGRRKYSPPTLRSEIGLLELLSRIGRSQLSNAQLDFLQPPSNGSASSDVRLYYSGDLELLRRPGVAIVGARDVSEEGYQRASRLARELVQAGVVVVSGLAKGVDAAAHKSAISAGGSTVAVIGTPLDKAYPAENAALQEELYLNHLLISPFVDGERVYPSNFPKRNRVMAAVSDATVIVEASDSSGTLHQAAECQRIGRWLFIMQSVANDPTLKWPGKFLGKPKTAVISSTADVVGAISNDQVESD